MLGCTQAFLTKCTCTHATTHVHPRAHSCFHTQEERLTLDSISSRAPLQLRPQPLAPLTDLQGLAAVVVEMARGCTSSLVDLADLEQRVLLRFDGASHFPELGAGWVLHAVRPCDCV